MNNGRVLNTSNGKRTTAWYWSWLASFAAIWLTNVVFACINHLPWYANAISGVVLLIVTLLCYVLLQHHRMKPVDYIVFAGVMAVVLVVSLALAWLL